MLETAGNNRKKVKEGTTLAHEKQWEEIVNSINRAVDEGSLSCGFFHKVPREKIFDFNRKKLEKLDYEVGEVTLEDGLYYTPISWENATDSDTKTD